MGGHARREAATEREKSKKLTTREEAAKKAEEAKWKDDGDKAGKAKAARQKETENKAIDLQRRQQEKKELLLAEETALLGKKYAPPKMKQADIRISALAAISVTASKNTTTIYDTALEPNLNKPAELTESGSGTVGAISALVYALDKVEIDAHPERRMKAAHLAFEQRRLKELEFEKPGLKRSQYKEIIWKEWLKSPENPKLVTEQ